MGCELYIYLVSFEQLRGLRGSKNADLCLALEREFEQEDEFLREDDPGERSAGAPSLRQVLRQYIKGDDFQNEFGDVYGKLLWYLCRHFGEEIERVFLPGGDTFARANSVLRARHVFQVVNFDRFEHNPPMGFPICSEPGLGHISFEAAEEAVRLLTPLNLERVTPLAAEWLTRLYTWMRQASEGRRDIVMFIDSV